MASDVNRREEVSAPPQEGNLLIEAVSLLVQRQRETETWVSEQLWQAEQRAGDTERRYAELESRLASIEAHLARLATDLEPAADDARVARLREQLADLRNGQTLGTQDETASTRPIGELFQPSETTPPVSPAPTPTPTTATASVPRSGGYVIENPSTPAPVVQQKPVAAAATANVGFWELLGATPGDRFGVVLIGLGGVAVLYALLSQMRF